MSKHAHKKQKLLQSSAQQNVNNSPVKNIWDGIGMLFNVLQTVATPLPAQSLYFDADIKDAGYSYVVTVYISGFNQDDIYIEHNGNLLTVRARKKAESQSNNPYYFGFSVASQSYSRTFIVEEDISADNISSHYNNGVLTLILPKKKSINKGTVI